MISTGLSFLSYGACFIVQPHSLPYSTAPSTVFLHRSCNSLRKTRTVLLFSKHSTRTRESKKLDTTLLAATDSNGLCCCSASTFGSFSRTVDVQVSAESEVDKKDAKKRVFFLDVNPLCYAGNKPSMLSFGNWISLLFSQVTQSDPVIGVFDGENGSEHRRQLLPSYKSHRIKFFRQSSVYRRSLSDHVRRPHQAVVNFLRKCRVPAVKVSGHEADDVIATLVVQALRKGYRPVIASPDKDFKQLITDDIQIVMPLDDLGRWSFYTLRHYRAQYGYDPESDLSLRCMLGDEVDGVPGIQHVVPAFGRKTAVKLIKKHGSLESLLNAASVRTVGRPYVQDALTKHVDYLRRNYEVLSLKRDVDVKLEEEWLVERDTSNDLNMLSELFNFLKESKEVYHNNSTTVRVADR